MTHLENEADEKGEEVVPKVLLNILTAPTTLTQSFADKHFQINVSSCQSLHRLT